MPLPNTFANLTTAQMVALDQNDAALGALGIIPCTIAGSDALVLTPNANTPTVAAYVNYQQFSGIVAANNTTTGTARIGSLAILPIYKDSPTGPIALAGGELVQNNMITLRYDSALNSGGGGFHLSSSTGSGAYLPVTGGTLTGNLSIAGASATVLLGSISSLATLNATKLLVGASAASITRILSTLASVGFTVVPANSTQDQPILVPGALANDSISIGGPASITAGVGFTGYVAAAGTVNLRALNVTAASIAAFSVTVRATAMGFT